MRRIKKKKKAKMLIAHQTPLIIVRNANFNDYNAIFVEILVIQASFLKPLKIHTES